MHLKVSKNVIFLLMFCAFFILYFLLPKSFVFNAGGDFREFSYFLGPWYLQRYILMFLCLAVFIVAFFSRMIMMGTGFWLVFIVFGAFGVVSALYGDVTFIYAYCGVLGAYSLLSVFNYKPCIPRSWLYLYALLMFSYSFQYLFYSAGGRHVASFLDPNISGYYLFLTYAFFRYCGFKFFAIFSLVMGLLSLSRNFYLAVFLFEVLFYLTSRGIVAKSSILRNPFFVFFLSMAAVVSMSYYVVYQANVTETIGGSADRLTNVMDGSNYARSHANTDMIDRILSGDFLYVGNGAEYDGQTEHRPHNAFFRAIYRYGLPIGVLVLFLSLLYMKKVSKDTYPLLVGVFTYYSILNDFISGPELSLLLIVSYLSVSGRNSLVYKV